MTKLTQHFNTTQTPQSEPIPGMKQAKNNAGGFVFQLDKWKKLDRFLILGTEGGTYYVDERKHTVANSTTVLELIAEDGPRVVRAVVDISDKGRAPKNDQAIFVLALCMKKGNDETKRLARQAVPTVCRIGTHVFQLADSLKAFGGWGRGTRNALAAWYTGQETDRLAMNLIKYQNREGWTHVDLLRKAHAQPKNEAQGALFRWLTTGSLDAREVKRTRPGKKDEVLRTDSYGSIDSKHLPPIIEGFEKLRATKDEKEAVKLIQDFNLPRECVPTELLNSAKVWEALLYAGKGMPFTAMIRNLAKMTSIGLAAPLSDATKFIVQRLQDKDGLKKARVHPITILMAMKQYALGKGLKGSLVWTPVGNITDALNDAFYLAFDTIVPTGKNYLLGLDVSGSMSMGMIGGTAIMPSEAAAAMAMVAAKTEPWTQVMGFADQFRDLGITRSMRLDDVMRKTQHLSFGGTDCALPMLYALKHKLKVEVFHVYTDNETWAGTIHPVQALNMYRQQTGIPAKLVVVGMTATDFTIADPNDAGMMDVVGFDSAAPTVMADFARQ